MDPDDAPGPHTTPSVDDLLRALESRDLIGQAKGILMERHRITADDAFTRLTQISQNSNTKLVEVAAAVVGQRRPAEASPLDGHTRVLNGVKLRPREAEILRLVVDGCTNKQIAEHLYLSVETVRTHLQGLFAKIGVTNRTQAAMWAVRPGYQPPRIGRDLQG